ncbi:MAG TPA: tetratricopeptide repeat protein [Burkholderiaceae bacterium]|nr:tetratricopeptide repeat protein [Burkholderiaceae bacterium]
MPRPLTETEIESLEQAPGKPVDRKAVLPKLVGKFAAKHAPVHWKTVLQALLIVAAGLWIYWPALHGGWLWDDSELVTDNSNLRDLQGLWQIWLTPKTDYWPLTWTLLWMEWHLWGNEPLGYHLCSLALHICSGILIWRLFNRLGLRWGWLGGFLFVIHPLAVESVAWVSETKNTLSLPFFLLSIDAWLDAEAKQSSDYRRSVFYYLAAMLAKTSTVMLPLVLLLYCWWKRGHVTWQELKRMVPYVAIAVTLGLITVYSQNNVQGYNPVELGGPVTRLIGAGTAVFFYLGKFILPVNLLPIYPRWSLNTASFLQVLALPALATLLFSLWTQRGGWGRHALFGFGFFLLSLVPVLGLVKMRYLDLSWVGDHLVYVPIIGLVGLIVMGLERLHERLSPFPHLIGVGTMSIVAVIGLLLWESHHYARLFNNSEAFWAYTVQHNPHALVAHYNFGLAFGMTGRMSEAIEQFEQALKIKPDFAEAHNNLGIAFRETGRMSEAIEQFEQALKIKPNYALAHNNLGIALGRTGRMSEAVEQFQQSLKIKPDFAEAHNNLGIAFRDTGRVSEAVKQFEQALKIKPDFALAHNNLANAQAILKSNPAKD